MSQFCAPTSTYDYTCFTTNSLKRIAKKLNNDSRYIGGKKIDTSTKNKKKLVNDISKKLNCGSKLDFCVLKNEKKFSDEIRNAFKPKGPPGKYEWLSSLDIKKVMDQYMKKYPDFYFIGPVPIDFEFFYDELANINLKTLSKKGKRIGVVFNTDPSYKSGQHWISLFLDLKNKTLCFFDSAADEPPKEVQKLMKKIISNAKKHGVKLQLVINNKVHQKKDSECGVYSIYHIISRLEGKSCSYIYNNIIGDEKMNSFRKKFFRKN
jgi:hypothetical protein